MSSSSYDHQHDMQRKTVAGSGCCRRYYGLLALTLLLPILCIGATADGGGCNHLSSKKRRGELRLLAAGDLSSYSILARRTTRSEEYLRQRRKRQERRRRLDEDQNETSTSSSSSDDDIRTCKTKAPTKCDRLLLRNTYEVFVTRQATLAANETIANNTQPIAIEVFFHKVVNTNMTAEPLMPATITLFMNRLNKAFRETKFRFTFVNQSLSVNDFWHTCQDQAKEFKEATHVGGPRELNVWLCDTRLDKVPFLGQSRYPNIAERHPLHDGITLLNPEFVAANDSIIENLFEIYWQLPHQTAHWLGLLHPATGGCHDIAKADPSPTFLARGDGVSDTPPQDRNSMKVRGVRRCFQWKSTRMPDTCPAVPGRDDVFNYANVIPWRCWARFGHFTPEQEIRMEAMYREYRELGRRQPVEGFTPLRADIIKACVQSAVDSCDACDVECLLKFGKDAFDLIQIGASREILEG